MTTMRVTPTVAMDWLVRSLLPGLLVVAAGRFASDENPLRVQAAELADRLPVLSAGDRYEVAGLVSALRRVHAELVDELLVERRWVRGRVSTIATFGGSARFRSVFLPELDAITGLVTRVFTVRECGDLARRCVESTIALAMIRADDAAMDRPLSGAEIAGPLREAYEVAFRALALRCEVPLKPEGEERIRVRKVRKPSGSLGWRGVFVGDGGTVVCPHIHGGAELAKQCAVRLSQTVTVAA